MTGNGILSEEESLRLNLIRFPLIVGVVFIHAYDASVSFSDGQIGSQNINFVTNFVRNAISQGIARTAVPLFFLISGFLFFYGFQWSVQNYVGKIRSRIKSLLIPFLFWNVLTLLVIAVVEALPMTRNFVSGKHTLIGEYTGVDYFIAIFGIGRYPISYQMWFIRDLMCLVLFAPVIFLLGRKVALPYCTTLFVCWIFDVWPPYSNEFAALLFFSVGMCAVINGKSLFAADPLGLTITAIYLILLVFVAAYLDQPYGRLIQKVGIVFGVITALFLTKTVRRASKLEAVLLWLSTAGFFVFAAHEPPLTIARKIAYKLFRPDSSYEVLAIYLLVPSLLIVALVLAFAILSRCFPRMMRVITGGR